MKSLPEELYSTAQIRELEKLAIEKYDTLEQNLMERAGRAAFSAFKNAFLDAETVIVICGKGNNGGDGFVFARRAYEDNLDVQVYTLGNIADLPPSAKAAAEQCEIDGVAIAPFDPEIDLDADVIVDAILGIGVKGVPHGVALEAIQTINESAAEVLALDVPSGLDVDTGYASGEVILATATVTFIGLKRGMLTANAVNCCGDISCDNLMLPPELFEEVPAGTFRLTISKTEDYLLLRESDAHKGLYGHVLVIGGDYGMPGAVCMAGNAALRAGAGLVSVVTRPEHVSGIVAHCPELMCYGVSSAKEIKTLFEAATIIAIGPGLGESAWSKESFAAALETNKSLVVDASALHLLAANVTQRENWILTPHPGEAAALLGKSVVDIQKNRFNAVEALQKKYQGTVVLKGAGTIVQSDKGITSVCHAGNPGMASAGMGDILTGVIAGLWAQDLELEEAANIGVIIHSHAGDLAAEDGERGTIATDLLSYIRELVNPAQDIMGTEEDESGVHDIFEEIIARAK